MALVDPPVREPLDLTRARLSTRRWLADRAATAVISLAFVVALVPLVAVVGYVVTRGSGIMSWEFLTSDIPRQYRVDGGGMYPAIVGTLLTTGLAALMAIPLGVLGAIYLNELGRQNRTARAIRFLADVMTGVPSIVMGLFVYTIWVLRFERQSAFAGALALACLMLPIVIRSTEEMLRLVPDELRQGSLALGSHRWRTITSVVLPTALSGIISGAMLAIARAAGETAPLVFTVGLVYSPSWSLSDSSTALSAQIFRNASQPFAGAQDRAFGAALTLIVLVFAFTALSRFVASRLAIKS